jgi:hypothetical protein
VQVGQHHVEGLGAQERQGLLAGLHGGDFGAAGFEQEGRRFGG